MKRDLFKDLKEEYENIPIPKNLDDAINRSISNYRKDEIRMKNKKVLKIIIAASLLVICSFTIGVNTNESFATTAGNIPAVSILARLVSFDSFKIENEIVNANVNIPAVEGFESETLEKQINHEIHEKMNKLLEEGKERAKEYKKAFIETGGTEESFRPVTIDIDYKVRSYQNNILSFSIHYFEALGSSYSKTFFYTVDLEKNQLVTLEDLLGKNYMEKVNSQISNQIANTSKEESSNYFQGDLGFKSISRNQKFYINQANQIVVVFDKYKISPGSSGEPEFIIQD